MNYYVHVNNQTGGPYPEAQLREMLAAGQIAAETPCCQEGDQSWQAVRDFIQEPPPAHAPAQPQPEPPPLVGQPSGRFSHPTYLVRRKIFSFFGGAFHIYDPTGAVVFYSKMKAFKFKEDIRIYTGEDMKTETLVIKARKIMDLSSAYDVTDPTTNAKIGVLKRKGLKSIVKDEWIFLDANDQEIGLIKEDSTALALLRRLHEFIALMLPQKYVGEIRGAPVCTFKQNFNPFVMKITLDFSPDVNGALDRRLGIAAAILLCAIERKQS